LGISQSGQFQGSFGLVVGKSTRPSRLASSAPPPNYLLPVFSCEKALNVKNINRTRRPRSRLPVWYLHAVAGGVLPPVNPNGKRGLVAQAFSVVLVGLCKFNIKWILISIVKIWSKTCTSRRNISVFSKNGICSTCWQFFF
jgi:hypothetical protein